MGLVLQLAVYHCRCVKMPLWNPNQPSSGGTGSYPATERKRGSDGASGNTVFTLTNTHLSREEIVTVNGIRQVGGGVDYTASHLAASSTITFGVGLNNNDYVDITYFT